MPVLADRMARVGPSAIMELIKVIAKTPCISFASGLPDPALFPGSDLKQLASDLLDSGAARSLQYGPAEGVPDLRCAVAEIITARGLPTEPDQVLITSGSQQALDLVCRAVLNEGDTVALDNPSYLAAIQAFESCGARYRLLPADLEDDLPPPAGIRLVFQMPNFHNPLGRTLDGASRRRLAGWVQESGAFLLEDDAYHDLRYSGTSLPPISAQAPEGAAFYTGSFSKVLAPGLRVGYVRSSAGNIERLGQLKQVTDLHTGSFSQDLVLAALRDGVIERSIARLRAAYGRRKAAMNTALAEHAGGLLEWTEPEGGMFIFCRLVGGGDAAAMLEAALRAGVAYVPGAPFHVDGSGRSTLRLNFVSAPEDQIAGGIQRLCRVLHEAA